jgi:hypothetical protein
MKAGFFMRACAVYLAAMAISILVPATLRAALVTNPSFEADGNIYLDSSNATRWSDNIGSSKFLGDIWNTNFHTDGSRGVILYTTATSGYSANSYAYLSQSVDLSGISSVMFDAKLSVLEAGAWESSFEADFYVDSTKEWSRQLTGTYLDQSIDVAGLSGMHTIEFRLQANSSGPAGYTNQYEFDNVRVTSVPEPSSIAFFCAGVIGLLIYARRRNTAA